MPALKKNPDWISNYFDGLIDGIGARRSSFTDVDALYITHDGAGRGRALLQEFKHERELPLRRGQREGLEWLATLRQVTVWLTVKRLDGRIGLTEFRTGRCSVVTPEEYRERFARWWRAATEAFASDAPVVLPATGYALCPDSSLCTNPAHRAHWLGEIGIPRCALCWRRAA